MATTTLNLDGTAYNVTTEKPVVKSYEYGIDGGRVLDATGFTPTVIYEGHVVITETATGAYKPMPISGSAYAALPTGHTYAGIMRNSVLTEAPAAGIMTKGVANPNSTPYPMTSILAAFKTAVPGILWQAD